MAISYSLEIQTTPDRNSLEAMALSIATSYLVAFNQRLDRGVGVNGQQMPPYSEGYKKQRARRGRQTRVRDLRLTNEMRRSYQIIDQTISENGFTVKFGFITARAREKALHNHIRSPFVGFSESDILAIQAALNDFIQRENSRNSGG